MKEFVRILLIAPLFSFCFSCQNGKFRDMELYPIMENGLYGFIDTLGNKVVVPQYLCVSPFSNHLAAAVVDTFFEYRADSTFHNLGLAYAKEVKKERYLYVKYGYINIENEFVIKPTLVRRFPIQDGEEVTMYGLEYGASLLSFHEGLAAFQDSTTGLFGFVDTLGYQIIPAQYYNYQDFSSSKAAVQIFKRDADEPISDACFKWGYIDQKGQKKSDFIYSQLSSCMNGRSFGTIYSLSKDQDPHPIIKHKENGELEIEESDYDKSMPRQSIATVLLDENGNVINNSLSSLYIYYTYSKEGVAVAVRKGAEFFGSDFKFIDLDGKYLEPHDVNNAHPAFEGLVPDEYHFSNVTAMSEGYAGVMGYDSTWVFVDKNLNYYSPVNGIPYEAVGLFSNGIVAVCQGGKWGYVDKDFNLIIPLKYDWAENAGKHLMRVAQIDEASHIVIESYINRRDSIVWQRIDNRNK